MATSPPIATPRSSRAAAASDWACGRGSRPAGRHARPGWLGSCRHAFGCRAQHAALAQSGIA
eukprot:6651848-Prymnesium_polylepis.1